MSGKNPPVITSRNRRSTRRRGQEQDHVVAPGFGTKQDIEKLAKDLSSGSDAKLPAAAVEGMIHSVFVTFGRVSVAMLALMCFSLGCYITLY